MPKKTGGWGGTWVVLDSPKPPKVANYEEYWSEAPPQLSARCMYWLRQIHRGWRPSRRIPDCYCCGSEWYGVYIWEYVNAICPLLDIMRARHI
jgi:hypothetical protein